MKTILLASPVLVGINLGIASTTAMAIEMDDLEVTIRVIDSEKEDLREITNTIELPEELKQDTERHAGDDRHDEVENRDGEDGKEHGEELDESKEDYDEAHEHRDEVQEDYDEAREERDEVKDDYDDAKEDIEEDDDNEETGGDDD
jgi:hypothetical protein